MVKITVTIEMSVTTFISVVLIAAAAIVSAIRWRQLHAEPRQPPQPLYPTQANSNGILLA